MDSFKKYVQGTFGNWSLEPENLYVGRELEIPETPNHRAFVVRIVRMDDKNVWILEPSPKPEYNKPQYATKVPIASLYHFVDDLSGQLMLKPKHENKYIAAVLNGQGQYLGKGEDGVTYRYKDKVIKVGTTVPYHPVHYNRPHRTPEEAVSNLRTEYDVSEKLLQKGVPGILPGEFLLHDGRAFLIRPFIQVIDKEKLPLPLLIELKESVEKIHQAGYSIRDMLQYGLWNEHIYHYDLGSVKATTDKWDFDGDMSNVQGAFLRSGFDMTNPPTYEEMSFEEKKARFKRKK